MNGTIILGIKVQQVEGVLQEIVGVKNLHGIVRTNADAEGI